MTPDPGSNPTEDGKRPSGRPEGRPIRATITIREWLGEIVMSVSDEEGDVALIRDPRARPAPEPPGGGASDT